MTLHLDDARWRTANTARLLDEPSEIDPAWLGDYTPHDAETAAEKALLDGLAVQPDVNVDDAAAVANALQQWEQQAPSPAIARGPRRLAIAAALLAVGVAAGLLLSWVGPTTPDEPEPSADLARAATPVTPPPREAPTDMVEEKAPPGWTVRSGGVVAEAIDDPSAPLPHGISLVATGQLCTSSTEHAQICLDDGSRFEVGYDDRIELVVGRARVRTHGGRAPRVRVADIEIEANDATVYVVEQRVAGWSLVVEDGAAVVHTQHSEQRVQAGQRLSAEAERAPPRSTGPTPAARLASARAARAAGDLDGAAKAYQALISAAPRSPLARVASVSLGQLYLELGRPKKARAAFERYLSRGPGTLSEDAAFGRLRALRAMGATKALSVATGQFLDRYPDGAYASRVRRWAD